MEYREQEFRTYEELRSEVMKWAINQKTQDERTQHDPMDCSHMPWNSAQHPAQHSDCNLTEEWKAGTDAAWGPSTPEANTEIPTDVDYAYSKGKGKGEGSSPAGKGQGEQQHSL